MFKRQFSRKCNIYYSENILVTLYEKQNLKNEAVMLEKWFAWNVPKVIQLVLGHFSL